MRIVKWTYLTAIHLVLGLTLWKSNFVEIIAKNIGVQVSQPDEIGAFQKDMIGHQKRLIAQLPNDAVLFIGDSIVQGLYTTGIVARAVNLGIGGETTVGLIKRISSQVSLRSAKSAYIGIGINDFGFRGPDTIAHNFEKIFSLLPNTKLYVGSILPIDADVFAHSRATNPKISATNDLIKQACASHPNCTYIDTFSHFIDESGNLNKTLHEGDGLHLNTKGYKQLAILLKPFLSENR